MKYRQYHCVFLGLLGIAVATNIAIQLVARIEANTILNNEKEIVSGYETLNELGETSIALNRLMAASALGDVQGQTAHEYQLQKHIEELTCLSESDSDLERSLQALVPFRDAEGQGLSGSTAQLNHFLNESRQARKRALQSDLQSDFSITNRLRYQIYLISSFALLLIFSLGLVWWRFHAARARHERALEGSILSFERTNLQLQQILEKKSRELRATVHDLKNPLGSIKGFSELLADGMNNPKSMTQMTQAIQRLADHTLNLVGSLLDLESSSASVVSAQRNFNLVSYLEDVCYVMNPQAQAKGQKIHLIRHTPTAEIVGDPKKIWDAFMNLISNAIKFSPPHSEIHVTISTDHRLVQLEVEDDGPGFNAEDKEKAFGKYTPLTAKPTGGESSSGLGLNIVRTTVLAHGGSIEILDAKTLHGALVVVHLPLAVQGLKMKPTAKSLAPPVQLSLRSQA